MLTSRISLLPAPRFPLSAFSFSSSFSSIIGGATGINYVIGMVRTKAVAVLLGPSGVGLVGMVDTRSPYSHLDILRGKTILIS